MRERNKAFVMFDTRIFNVCKRDSRELCISPGAVLNVFYVYVFALHLDFVTRGLEPLNSYSVGQERGSVMG